MHKKGRGALLDQQDHCGQTFDERQESKQAFELLKKLLAGEQARVESLPFRLQTTPITQAPE